MLFASTYDQLNPKLIFEAASWNRCELSRKPGSFSFANPIAESASWKYVVRALAKATFLPATFPRAYTIPCTVR